MSNEIELIGDSDGLVVLGKAKAVERFLRSEGLWDVSRAFDLRRVRILLAGGSDVLRAASEIAADSGRWIKLTEDSARLVKEHGLMESKTPGVNHLMIGVPGTVKSWLQTEGASAAVLTNPVALSSVAAIMAQTARQQVLEEITEYLVRIDEKVDDVLAKVDGTVLKDMTGARLQIRRAHTMRDEEGRVSDESWSEVQNASGKVADVQGYALHELERMSIKLEAKVQNGKVGALAEAVEQARPQVRKWLAVIADCFQLQESFDVLVLDRALEETPEVLNARRRGLDADRRNRLDSMAQQTRLLVSRMDAAVIRANERLFWTRNHSLAVVDSSNQTGAGLHEFCTVVGIDSELHSWGSRTLGPVLTKGAQAVQGAKDVGPYGLAAAAGIAVAKKALSSK